jgi:hypothetical protein
MPTSTQLHLVKLKGRAVVDQGPLRNKGLVHERIEGQGLRPKNEARARKKRGLPDKTCK